MFEKFKNHRFIGRTQQTVDDANSIIAEYEQINLQLTIRQLYYQFVARDLFANNLTNYNKLIYTMTRAREAGLVSWDAIEDNNRTSRLYYGKHSVESVWEDIEYSVVLDPWQDQSHYVEVWIEKDALVNTIRQPCNSFRVRFMACKGYMSASEAWRAGKRFQKAHRAGKDCVLIHLGDHDPSGLDMTRDNRERSELFSNGVSIDVRRIALNMDQIEKYNPPPNPAKMTDTRVDEYVKEFGESSWELDALDPRTIGKLVQDEIRTCIDKTAHWDYTFEREQEMRDQLVSLRENWDDVKEFLNSYDT